MDTIMINNQQDWIDQHNWINENTTVVNNTDTAFDIPDVLRYFAKYKNIEPILGTAQESKCVEICTSDKTKHSSVTINKSNKNEVVTIARNCKHVTILQRRDADSSVDGRSHLEFEAPENIEDISFEYPHPSINFWCNGPAYVIMDISKNAEDNVIIESDKITNLCIINEHNKHVTIRAPNCKACKYNGDNTYCHIEQLCDNCKFR